MFESVESVPWPKFLLSSPPWTTSLHNTGKYVIDKVVEYVVEAGGLADGSEELEVDAEAEELAGTLAV